MQMNTAIVYYCCGLHNGLVDLSCGELAMHQLLVNPDLISCTLHIRYIVPLTRCLLPIDAESLNPMLVYFSICYLAREDMHTFADRRWWRCGRTTESIVSNSSNARRICFTQIELSSTLFTGTCTSSTLSFTKPLTFCVSPPPDASPLFPVATLQNLQGLYQSKDAKP